MPDCRNCGAPVKAAKFEGSDKGVPLENQPEVFRAGDDRTDFVRVLSGARNPMIVGRKTDDVPGSFFKIHRCDARV